MQRADFGEIMYEKTRIPDHNHGGGTKCQIY